MVYIDQPVQVGYSYDFLVNGTLDEVASPFQYKPANFSQTPIPETNLTFLTGTFPSGSFANSPNTTLAAAPFIWDFMQTWIQEFPGYKSVDNRVSMWGQSYGGHYGPIYADYFEQQNDKIANGSLKGSAIPLHIDTVGLINACIDIDVQMDFYAEYAHNNTFGVKLITDEAYESALAASPKCKEMSATCRSLSAAKDPNNVGNQPDVNAACKGAFDYCFQNIHDFYNANGRDKYDIAGPAIAQPFPPKWAAGYLNDAETQQALGVGQNWTGTSVPAAIGFDRTGDFIIGDGLKKLGGLLDRGVKVSLLYGDRDFQCNWLGGEAISTAIESRVSSDFKKAGYADIETNASYNGGFVRQHGNLSFARIFQAGHLFPFYQPETAAQIFKRVMLNQDVATGKVSTTSDYSSVGRDSAWSTDTLPTLGPAKCYLWDVLETCTQAEGAILLSGNAIVEDYVLVGVRNGTTNSTSKL
ncbi:alpha/beta-hydrolase [Phaeosphaeriaceae sp. SRC1lsM3a]|nr:alpha/beta-hydrolase [Stagonospora sp. SRC1lsM3a]